MKSRNEFSAGGVVYRRSGNGVEVLVCKDAGYHKWVLPKGLIARDESPEQAALREVSEEVGVRARLVAPLGDPEKYVYTARGVRVFKSVYYFLMEYESGSEAEHDHEMEEVKWASIDDAVALMGYKGAKDVLQRAKARLADSFPPPDTPPRQ
jgi:8-oxo-dGTP pyrophosphatase MutT (NUDIX family)